MDSQQPGARRIEPDSAVGSRARWATLIVAGLVLYGAFVALCFDMEAEARPPRS